MSISKCPVCQSTDINSITCNNCGAMLLFMGDDRKDNQQPVSKHKEQRSTESIIQEILESANVKASPFEKIEYIDNTEASAEGCDLENIVTDKSFADLAREIGYEQYEEPEAVAKGPAIFQHNLQPPDKEAIQKVHY